MEAQLSIEQPTRRRAIAVLAATAAGFAAAQHSAQAAIDYEWRGLSMGADARILFCGIDRNTARALIAMALAEIERLEMALSLFRSDSEICRLNHDQTLASPSADLRRALALALAIAQATGGLFDPTVQALWETYVDWFAAAPDRGLPPRSAIAAAMAAVDWRRIALEPNSIRLGPRQRITLNGLGQGYVTDRVADLLRAHGLEHVLVDLGEQRALGPRPNGAPWLIACDQAQPLKLRQGALATSAGAGCILGAAGAVHHLFDPRTGCSASHWRQITVHHRSAAVADALSTALYAASADEMALLLARLPGVAVLAADHNGQQRRWNSDATAAASI
jgi:thiamine biosynthesis lipoprotein